MSFIQAGMLGALAALAIPILIHLMFRRQARPVDLGTLQFLKIVLRDNAKKRRLKRYVLLALRLAGVALIAFLFARPYLLASEPIDGRRLVVVIADRSASMGLSGGKRPIDRAAVEVRSIVGKAGNGTQLEVAAFDRTVTPIAKPADAASALASPSIAGTDYGQAMAWARDVIVRSKAARKELHVLTDLQKAGLDRGDSALVPSGTVVSLVDLGRSFPKNVGVIAVSARPRASDRESPSVISATIRNASPMPAGKVAGQAAPRIPRVTTRSTGRRSSTSTEGRRRPSSSRSPRSKPASGKGTSRRSPATTSRSTIGDISPSPSPRPPASSWSTATRAIRPMSRRPTSSTPHFGSRPRGRPTPRPRSTLASRTACRAWKTPRSSCWRTSRTSRRATRADSPISSATAAAS